MIAATTPAASDEVAGTSFSALGTTAQVVVTHAQRLVDARAAVEETLEAFDLAASRFRPDSELSRVNAAAGSRVNVGPLLLDAVAAALRAARLTDGDVDPTVGMALIGIGYDRDFAEVCDAHERAVRITAVPGWRTIELDLAARTIKLARGVSLDLGATAKALAADRAAAAAHAATGCGVLVNLGGDISVAGPPPVGGWRVRVADDHRAGIEAPGQWIALHSGALATSSTTVRRWRMESRWVHHVVDPSTGAPADSGWRTATVAGASCVDANTASTAAIIRGRRSPAWLEQLSLPSRLVATDGRAVHLAGWPSEGDDLR